MNRLSTRVLLLLSALPALVFCAALRAQTPGVVLVNHAPSINGTLNGSLQQMLDENGALNGGGAVTGDWLVPGTPQVRVNGKPAFSGAIAGLGDARVANYVIKIGGSSQLSHLVTGTDGVVLPLIPAPAEPAGIQSVTATAEGGSPIDFKSLRDLTLSGTAGKVAVPAGTYGDFTAGARTGFVLGVAGSTLPSKYDFQHLTLTGNATLDILGPVVVTVSGGVILNGVVGNVNHPEWLKLRVASGDLTLKGGANLFAYTNAPSGTVMVNGGARLTGGLIADSVVIDGSGMVRAINRPPHAAIDLPHADTVLTAPVAALTINAAADDLDGYVAKVEFCAGGAKLGESCAPPYRFVWSNLPAGTYVLTSKSTDNSGAVTESEPVTFVSNAPPAVSLTSPVDHSVFAVPGSFILSTNASDSDGTVAKVEFFENGIKVGESARAPYQIALSGLPTGRFTYTARATDNYGASTESTPCGVIVELPPTSAVTAPPAVSCGTGVVLTATAKDSDGTVAKVEFYRGGTLLGQATSSSGTGSTYVYTDADALNPGTYTYVARSYDNLGLYTDSTAATVTVLATLPYTADFESGEGYMPGPIARQLGWTASSDKASITEALAFNGVRSIALAPDTPPVRVAQSFAPYPGHDVVFMDFLARPVAEPEVTNSTTFDVEGARFAFVQDGAAGVLNVCGGDGNGGGTWRATPFTAPLGQDNQVQNWTRLTARLDFAHKTWDLYAGGQMVAADLKFRDHSASYLSSFAVRGDSATVSRLDYLFAGADNPLFADANNNGIDDAWETAHGLSLATSNRNNDPDGDGVTNIAEYIVRTDPSDFYNGQPPVLTSLVASNGQPGADGLVEVRVTRQDGTLLANAPVVFQIASAPAQVAAAVGGAASGSISARSDSQGVARCYVTFGSATTASLTVTAKAGAASASITILLNSPNAGPPPFDFHGETPVLKVVSGDKQAKVSGYLPLPLVLAVYHADGTTPWPSAPVTLSVDYGTGGWAATSGGTVTQTLTVAADANGIVHAYYWIP